VLSGSQEQRQGKMRKVQLAQTPQLQLGNLSSKQPAPPLQSQLDLQKRTLVLQEAEERRHLFSQDRNSEQNYFQEAGEPSQSFQQPFSRLKIPSDLLQGAHPQADRWRQQFKNARPNPSNLAAKTQGSSLRDSYSKSKDQLSWKQPLKL